YTLIIASLAFGAILLSGLLSCKQNSSEPNPAGPQEIGKAQVWLTSGDKSRLLSKEEDLSIKDSLNSPFQTIKIDTTETFQEIEGFGAALTGSSAYLLNRILDEQKRAEALKDLFDPVDGIGISYLRLTMGASDFSLSDFTYDDLPVGQTDFNLEQFSLAQDLDDVVPVLKEIMLINPELKLMGSPWSPPAWMKTNGNLKGGKLKEECYGVYADYFVRYIQEMAGQGIVIDAITPQNEPLYFTASYPCMEMQPAEQADFIKNHLGPKFSSAGINTKIIIYDHNWDNTNYAISILDDPGASAYITGSAFHAYAGQVMAMSTVHNAHPDKGLYFTEISGGEWAKVFSDNLIWYTENIFIGTTRNWSKVALFWNLVLNQYHGPQNHGCSDCRGVITISEFNGYVTKNEEYYALAHFSKFVRPGAVRISVIVPQGLTNTLAMAFVNPDGSKSLVVCNKGTDARTFSVIQGKKIFKYSLHPESVVTITW
ncbi:MAG: glucan endo-1,6-beta-glucosidase, partial [Bacteroidales bacterium]|nr:glucan endo-1,6-beta-glucosidase [Bacteroidales bacterium]